MRGGGGGGGGGGGVFFFLHIWYKWANIVTTPSQYGHVWTIGERNQLKELQLLKNIKSGTVLIIFIDE